MSNNDQNLICFWVCPYWGIEKAGLIREIFEKIGAVMFSYPNWGGSGGYFMKVLDLFSGIGGFSLGLERAGMETIAFCEENKHAQHILKKHWPNVPIFEDVRLLDGTQFKGTVDVVCGGFPCQDLSLAGKKAGIEGARSSLYREMLRIISECLPRYAIFENVSALITGDNGRWFAQFLYDLASIGFDAEWHCISASEIGANHHRDRVWIIAYTKNSDDRHSKNRTAEGQKQKFGKSPGGNEILANPKMQRCERRSKIAYHLKQQIESMRSFEIERRGQNIPAPYLCGANDGIPRKLDRIKRLGNAVVPQIPEAIGRALMAL